MVKTLEADRNRASDELEFEKAAQIHARMLKVEAVSSLASEIVRPLSELDAVILQPSADPLAVAVFLVTKGVLSGPALYSTVGMRHPNEQSGSSSLFAHPTAIEPVVLEDAGEATAPVTHTVTVSRDALEQRLDDVLNACAADKTDLRGPMPPPLVRTFACLRGGITGRAPSGRVRFSFGMQTVLLRPRRSSAAFREFFALGRQVTVPPQSPPRTGNKRPGLLHWRRPETAKLVQDDGKNHG